MAGLEGDSNLQIMSARLNTLDTDLLEEFRAAGSPLRVNREAGSDTFNKTIRIGPDVRRAFGYDKSNSPIVGDPVIRTLIP